jgi:hypothetical protein
VKIKRTTICANLLVSLVVLPATALLAQAPGLNLPATATGVQASTTSRRRLALPPAGFRLASL